MDIVFKTTNLQADCSEMKRATRRYGPEVARKLFQRLAELLAAQTLAEMATVAQARCEELKADRRGQLSVRLPGALRLILEPANHPLPRKPDGGLDWSGVTAITVIEIEDYHG